MAEPFDPSTALFQIGEDKYGYKYRLTKKRSNGAPIYQCCRSTELNDNINCDAIEEYEQIRKFSLDTEQRSVCDQINRSNAGMFYINALAGVGKTSLINAILYGAAMNYKGHGAQQQSGSCLGAQPGTQV